MDRSFEALRLNRRAFLILSAGAGVAALTAGKSFLSRTGSASTATQFDPSNWITVRYPIPLPHEKVTAENLREFNVRDTLTISSNFEFDIVARWGDVVGAPGHTIRIGYNCDFTGLIPVPSTTDEYYLIINHEYVSARPWRDAYSSVFGMPLPDMRIVPHPDLGWSELLLELDGHRTKLGELDDLVPLEISEAIKVIGRAQLDEVGVSIVHVRQEDGFIRIIKDSKIHKRISADRKYNIHTPELFAMTGPAGSLVTTPPPGTFANCGGAVTPWGTFLSCEENYQEWVTDELTPDGTNLDPSHRSLSGEHSPPYDLPVQWEGLGMLVDPPLEPRHYGWVVEIDPASGHLVKHSALGRFRHENVALQVSAGQPLVAFMGDDRRGGHLWRFVSKGLVGEPKNPENSKLLHEGVLSCARFNKDGTGEWLPLDGSTSLVSPSPENFATGHLKLPSRPRGGYVSVGTDASEYPHISVRDWIRSIELFCARPFADLVLKDLVGEQTRAAGGQRIAAVILLEAFCFANAIGATPLARPEGIQVHPRDGSIYVAFSDSTGREIGSPDTRIFPSSNRQHSSRYGDLFRLNSSHESDSFTWSRWISSGEVADGGGGFACADNLAFDKNENLWMACDVETKALNRSVLRDSETKPGSTSFAGIFGNNALFCLETNETDISTPKCFAIGPMECELTGITFTEDGNTLLLSVQHPGERNGTRVAERTDEQRMYTIALPDGQTFEQKRTVPIGSNFPSGRISDPPRPCVVSIRRKK